MCDPFSGRTETSPTSLEHKIGMNFPTAAGGILGPLPLVSLMPTVSGSRVRMNRISSCGAGPRVCVTLPTFSSDI